MPSPSKPETNTNRDAMIKFKSFLTTPFRIRYWETKSQLIRINIRMKQKARLEEKLIISLDHPLTETSICICIYMNFEKLNLPLWDTKIWDFNTDNDPLKMIYQYMHLKKQDLKLKSKLMH